MIGCLASMLRFGSAFLEAVIDNVWELQRASEDCPLGSLDPFNFNPWFWDSPPIVLVLFRNLRDHSDVLLDAYRGCDSEPPPLLLQLRALAGPRVPTHLVSQRASYWQPFRKQRLPPHFQRSIYRHLLLRLVPDRLMELLPQKFARLMAKAHAGFLGQFLSRMS